MIIAISGKMGSGKTTIKDALKQYFELNKGLFVHELKFASPLYKVATAIQEHLAVKVEKDRELLQFIGSHYRGLYGKNFWADRLKDDITVIRYNEQGFNDSVILIDDLRYPEELKAIKEVGGFIVRLECDEATRAERVGSRLFLNTEHLSETALDGELPDAFDCKINTGPMTVKAALKIILTNMRIKDIVDKHG